MGSVRMTLGIRPSKQQVHVREGRQRAPREISREKTKLREYPNI